MPMHSSQGHPQALRRGFTLIELIATIVVLSVLGSVSAGIIFTATDGYLSATTTAGLHHEASLAMDRMTRELREIERADSAPEPRIDEVTSSSIRWEDDSELFLAGTTLQFIDAGESPVALAHDVSAFIIRVYDEDDVALPAEMIGSDCRDIRRIELTLTMSRHGESETVRTRVFVRAAMRGGATP